MTDLGADADGSAPGKQQPVPTPRGVAAALGAMVLLVAAGCATTPRELPVALKVSLNSDSYQTGEAVLATVEVANQDSPGGSELVVTALDDSTLKFYVAREGSPVRMRRRPVLPEKSPAEPRTLGPGQSTSRTFLFTRLTAEAGRWGLLAALSGCQAEAGTAEVQPTYYSRRVQFDVTDKVMFRRDPYSGLIVGGEAVRLAREHARAAEGEEARAVLVPLGESGLYVWTVFIGAGEDPVHKALKFAVNPYSGAVEELKLSGPLQEGGEE